MKRRPSADFALALLDRWVPDSEPLAGDLFEEFERRRSHGWLWRQVILAIVLEQAARRDRQAAPLGLADGGTGTSRPATASGRTISLSASPVQGIGGVGLVALAVLVSIVRPGAWWLLLAGLAGGILLGGALLMLRRPLSARRASAGTLLDTHESREG